MLSRLRALWTRTDEAADVRPAAPVEPPPSEIVVDGLPPFPLQAHLRDDGGFPALDWQAVYAWASTGVDDAVANRGWTACGRAWLQHLGGEARQLLPGRRSLHRPHALVAAAAEARTVLEFMERTPSRIVRILDGVAAIAPWGKDALVVFDDADAYYRYVARHYPEDGEFGFSGGMHLSEDGASYFVTMKAELAAIEPVIAHEMTHACLAHLPIPAWLNEGLAVNTERRLTPQPRPTITPQQVHRMHIRFWNPDTIQEFCPATRSSAATRERCCRTSWRPRWSSSWRGTGRAFATSPARPPSRTRARPRRNVTSSSTSAPRSARSSSATSDPAWSPDPERWNSSPERGAFA